VLLVWQPPTDNEWFTEFTTALAAGRPLPTPPVGAPGPFSLADPERARQLLTAAEFANPTLDDVRVPLYFRANPAETCQFVAGLLGWMLDGLDTAGQDAPAPTCAAALSSTPPTMASGTARSHGWSAPGGPRWH
jgi:hypothetical protein